MQMGTQLLTECREWIALKNRIETLEIMSANRWNANCDTDASLLKKINELTEQLDKRFNELDEKMSNIEHLRLTYRSEKKPFKCPVCDGLLLAEIKVWNVKTNVIEVETTNCHACKGSGIVWG